MKTVQPQVQGGDRETVTRRANLSKVGKKGKRMKSCKRQKTTKSAGGNKKKKLLARSNENSLGETDGRWQREGTTVPERVRI